MKMILVKTLRKLLIKIKRLKDGWHVIDEGR